MGVKLYTSILIHYKEYLYVTSSTQTRIRRARPRNLQDIDRIQGDLDKKFYKKSVHLIKNLFIL